MGKITKIALRNALLTALYIAIVGIFMNYAASIKLGNNKSFIAPIAFLLLFVSSAGLTGFLIFGKPAQMYIDGKKKDAVSLVVQTLGFMCTLTIVGLLILFFLK